MFELFSIVIVLSAMFAYINHRFIKMPSTIGLMLLALILSIVVLILGKSLPVVENFVLQNLKALDFSKLLLEAMLSFMLFAGAIHIHFDDLKKEKFSIILFSTFSVLLSTFLVGFATQFILSLFSVTVPFTQALLFGALISPTDPISVLAILKKAGVSKSLETKIAGESLFNDGVAVVVFLTILSVASGNEEFSFTASILLFGKEAVGGILFGALIGLIGFKLIKSIDHYQTEVLITLALVMGGYALAQHLHISGPLAMVVSGLLIGNQGKELGMSNITQEYIDKFWELIDEILNAILFVLIGLELLLFDFNSAIIITGLILIIIVLIIRFISVLIPSLLISLNEKITKNTLFILTWGGLRGGISIALALSIPESLNKNIWVGITYIIVCFSILVQGLTIGKLAKKYNPR